VIKQTFKGTILFLFYTSYICNVGYLLLADLTNSHYCINVLMYVEQICNLDTESHVGKI